MSYPPPALLGQRFAPLAGPPPPPPPMPHPHDYPSHVYPTYHTPTPISNPTPTPITTLPVSSEPVIEQKGRVPLTPIDWPFLKSWLTSYDRPLPDQIVDKCKPLFCELCQVQMNAAAQAKMHYEGKVHNKHSRMFLAKWAAENNCEPPRKLGEAPPEVKKAKISKSEVSGLNANDLYCSVCDLSFTSLAHAQQHWQGRNHARKSAGLNPFKTGYFNKSTGKWQRNPPAVTEVNDEREIALAKVEETISAGSEQRQQFFCDLCKVGATCQAQLDMHLNGKSHNSKVKQSQKQPPFPQSNQSFSSPPMSTAPVKPVKAMPSQQAAVIRAKLISEPALRDYSQFRTPSGQFYCSSCNLSLNSEHQFTQHLQSKKHRSKGLATVNEKLGIKRKKVKRLNN